MPSREPITREFLLSILDYDPETGWFTWRWRPGAPPMWNKRWPGTVAGTVNKVSGYRHMTVMYVQDYAHRWAFLAMLGEIPPVVDHIDGDRDNNRWLNLRAATNSDNLANCEIRPDNTSGYRGVRYCRATDMWMARIQKDCRVFHLGRFKTKEEAAAVYEREAARLFGEFHRPRTIGTAPG